MRRIASFVVEKRVGLIVVFLLLSICCAFTAGLVKVNNDLYSFLPEYTETRRALTAMNGQFTTLGTAKIMVMDINKLDADILLKKLKDVEGVDSVTFDDTEEHYKDNTALYNVTFEGITNDEKSVNALNEIKLMLSDKESYIDSQVGVDFSVIIVHRMMIIGAIVVAIVIVLLLLTSRSFMEVPVLLLTFGAAALLQFGTNFFFKEISYVSNAVTLILQLALAIDYAVILCNRFAEEKQRYEPEEAMVAALSKAIPEIASSSLTTIGGLVAMTFMQFNLGVDLGKVLIKSILFSMLSVFLFMPGLMIIFNRAIDKTKHRNFIPRIDGIGNFAWETRKLTPLFFAVVLALAGYLAMNCPFSYNYYDAMPIKKSSIQLAHEKINETFGYSNMLAVVVPSGDYEKEADMLAEIAELEHISSVMGIASTEVGEGLRLIDEISISDFRKIANLDDVSANAIFAYYGASHGDYDEIRNNLSNYKIRILDLFLFLHDVVESGDDDIEISQENKDMIIDLYGKLTSAKKQLQGPKYSRMLVYCDTPVQSDESYTIIDEIHEIAGRYYGDDIFVAGDATCSRDLESTYVRDNAMVSIASIVFVVLIILFTFRNAGLPILLIAVIQGSIWINFSVPSITGNPVFFVGYLIVSAIQMGANIDYAIVVSNRYITLRAKNSKRTSIIEALNGALPTLITSGSILAIAGILIGTMTTEATTSAIGIALGRGTFISLFLVLFVLPQLLLWGDGFIRVTRFGTNRRSRPGHIFKNDFEDIAARRRSE